MSKQSTKRKFTDLMIERLPAAPKGKRLELRDEVLTGLWLRVTDQGVKSWSIMYEVGGRSRRHTLGAWPKFNVRAARDAAKTAFQKVADGIDPGYEKQVARAAPPTPDSVAAAVEEWLTEALGPRRKPWREKTKQGHRQVMRHDVLPYLGRRPLRTITRADAEAVIELSRQPIHLWRRLKRFFTWARKRGYIDASPIVDIDKPGHERSRDRVLSPRELAAFWRASVKLGWPFGPLFLLLLMTAQRREMVRSMEWRELDFDLRRWSVSALKMKMDKAHITHISAPVVDILQSLPRFDGSDLVFTTNGRTSVSGFSRATAKVRELMEAELGEVDPFVLHDLRRSFATIAADEEHGLAIDPHVVDKILAHTTSTGLGAVAQVYNKAQYLKERAAALDAWANYIARRVAPNTSESNVVELRSAK
jgi:integrase